MMTIWSRPEYRPAHFNVVQNGRDDAPRPGGRRLSRNEAAMGFKLDPREIGWAPSVMIEAASASACSCLRSRCSSSTPDKQSAGSLGASQTACALEHEFLTFEAVLQWLSGAERSPPAPRAEPRLLAAAFPHDATAVKHTLATLEAKLEVLMRLHSLGHKGKQHGGKSDEGQDQRVVQRAGSHMRRCAFGQTK